jgi:hypothetical protein
MDKDKALQLQIKTIEMLLKQPQNMYCADCNGKTPRWCSINLGVFICLRCSGKLFNMSLITKYRPAPQLWHSHL